MKFVRYTDWNQLPECADALFEAASDANVFYSRAWFECMSRNAIEDEHTLCLACVVSDDEILALLPLIENSGNKTWYSLKHGFSPVYSALVTENDQEQVIAFLADSISQLAIRGLLLEPVADDDNLDRLRKHLVARGFDSEYRFRQYNWIHRCGGETFSDYMASRPARLRNTIERKSRKLEREHGFDMQLFTGADVLEHMHDYYAVYDASWKQNEITHADFQDCFVESFSKAGWSRLGILYIKESNRRKPVAAQLWFVHDNKASIFRLAYDEAWKRYSTGSILTSFMMEYVLDTDKVDEIDFLTGNDAYKQDWMSERRQRYLLSCIKTTRFTSRYQRFTDKLKYLIKRS